MSRIKNLILISIVLIFVLINIAYANQLIWSKLYDSGHEDEVASAIQTSDDNYLVIGNYNIRIEDYGNSNFWLLKIDQYGDTLWTKSYDKMGDDIAISIIETSDSCYLFSGNSNSNLWLFKLDTNGDTLWTQNYSGFNTYMPIKTYETPSGNYLITGTTKRNENDSYNCKLVMTDSDGELIWDKSYGGDKKESASSIIEVENDNYIVAGSTESFSNGYTDIYVLKIDSLGDTLWTKNFGGSSKEQSTSIIKSRDGNYLISGYTNSFGAGKYDYYLLKIDDNGNLIWEKTYGGSEPELWPMIIQSYNDGYLLFGNLASSNSNAREIWAIQINSEGDTIWTKNILENFIIDPISITKTNDNGFLIAAEPISVLEDIYIMKTDSLLNFENILAIENDEKYSNDFEVITYPNPTNNQCNIEYRISQKSKIDINIYDIRGSNVWKYTTIQNIPGKYKYIWNLNSNMNRNLSSGVYIINVATPFWSENRKILYLK